MAGGPFLVWQVLSPADVSARASIMQTQYWAAVHSEAAVLVDTMRRHVLPAVRRAGQSPAQLEKSLAGIQASIEQLHAAKGTPAKAAAARELRLAPMESAREACAVAESSVPAELWSLATDRDLLCTDLHCEVPMEAPY